jgi:hypothetical protein
VTVIPAALFEVSQAVAHAVTEALAMPALSAVDDPAKPLVSPGVAGFLVTFGLALATLFLIRSMVKHLRKVNYSPEPGEKPKVPGQRPEAGEPRVDGDQDQRGS